MPPRRGSIYIATLGVSLMVTVIGVTALTLVRVERRSAAMATQLQQSRLNARAGIELALDTMSIANDAWRNKLLTMDAATPGPGFDITLPGGRVNLVVTDPDDAVLDNNAYDPVLLRATGIVGDARQIYQARVKATGVPMAFLGNALAANRRLEIAAAATLQVFAAPALTNDVILVNGEIGGSAVAQSFTGSGVIIGSFTSLAAPVDLPGITPINAYVGLGTPVAAIGPTVNARVIAPGVNPWGVPSNPDGVYVINTTSDLTISNVRLEGTLVIRAPGRKVTIDNVVFMRPARADYPVLIVEGELDLSYESDVFGQSSRVLSELVTLFNYNPAAAPYNGTSDIDILDTYPSRIEGLIHVRGRLRITGAGLLRGMIVAEAPAVADVARVESSFRIEHDSGLVTLPPMGYTRRVDMTLEPGSWTQVVDP